MSTKRIKIILSVLTAIFFISALFIYKANIAIDTAHKFDDGILNLKFIDNEITFSLNNIYDISNYDKKTYKTQEMYLVKKYFFYKDQLM